MKMLVVFDIDGTLADLRPRQNKAGDMPPRTNKKAFQMWLDRLQSEQVMIGDQPITQVLAIANVLTKQPGVSAVYLTGRCEKYRRVTDQWLKKVKAPHLPLLMRKVDDWRSASAYKKEAMLLLMKQYKSSNNQTVVFDDDGDGDCSKMYCKLGIVHCKVIC